MVFRWRRAEEPSRPIRNCYWVETERLLAGGYPCLRGEDASRKVLRKFLDEGIRQFIDLTEEGELPCYRALLQEEAAKRGETVTWQRFPIVDMDVPRSKPQMQGILDSIRGGLEADRPTYVHCWGGIGRTGLVVGCWLVEQGRTGDEALEEIQRLMAQNTHYRTQPASPQTWEQVDWVRSWPTGPERDE